MSKEQILNFIKNKNNLAVIIIFIIGVILMIGHGGNIKDAAVSNQTEERLGAMLSMIEGAGDVSVMISYDEDGEGERVKGVVVLADGGDNPRVKTDIYKAAEASLNIGANRICILKKEEE